MSFFSPPFAENGWRQLSNGHLQHISGIAFAKRLNASDVDIVQNTLPVFIHNLKQEGVNADMAEKLLKKLSRQAQAYFKSVH